MIHQRFGCQRQPFLSQLTLEPRESTQDRVLSRSLKSPVALATAADVPPPSVFLSGRFAEVELE